MKKLTTALACFLAVATIASAKAKSNDITIGGIFPLSGGVAVYGVECKKGVELAIEEINAAGGVNGMKFVLISEDDEGNPDKTVNAFTKLATKNKVKFVIGSLTSGCTKAITQRAQASKVIQLAPAATADDVTNEKMSYIFRACYSDSFQGTVGGKFSAETLKCKNAAVIYDIGNDYSVGLTENFIKAFEKAGGKIVAKESYATNDKDFNAQLTKIKNAKPDVVYIPDYYGTVALIAKQLRAQGINTPIVGADGWDGLQTNAGDEVLNGFYSNHYAADSTDPKVQKFVKNFKAKYKEEPNAFATLGYDCVYLLRDAILKSGSSDPAKDVTKVRDALEKTNGSYVTGNLTFDKNHNPVKSAVMVEVVKDGNALKTVYKTTVNP